MRELNAWYQHELNGLPVEIHTGEAVTAEQLSDMKADVIILAVGSVPVMPKVPGIDSEKVGQKVVVIGGGLVGCEMALDYAQLGKEVTVVEALGLLSTRKIFSR